MNDRVRQSILLDIREEFSAIQKDVACHTDSGTSVEHARKLLAQHVPSQVLNRSMLLLDTLLGYMIDEAKAKLSNASYDTKSHFFDLDLRSKIKHSVRLEPDTLTFSIDRRLVCGAFGAGGVLLVGGSATVFSAPTIIPPFFLGLGTLVVGAVAFKLMYSSQSASNYSMRAIKDDVERYLTNSEQQVQAWLMEAQKVFFSEVNLFINSHQQA